MARKTSKQDENLDHLLDEKTVEGLADRLKTKLLPDLIQKISEKVEKSVVDLIGEAIKKQLQPLMERIKIISEENKNLRGRVDQLETQLRSNNLVIHGIPLITNSPNFSPLQSAYRPGFSTETALSHIFNNLSNICGNRNCAVMVGLDLSAAFDTINHRILLDRLHSDFGIDGLALSWLRSYLSNRSQYVKLGDHTSPSAALLAGVPQGSVLGPLLFTTYTSPLSDIVKNFDVSFHQYADDTSLYSVLSNHSVPEQLDNLRKCTDAINDWHLVNFLQLNPQKSEVMFIGTPTHLKYLSPPPSINIAGTTLPSSSTTLKLLGVTFDSQLSFKQHAISVIKSCNHLIWAIRHIRPFLSVDTTSALARSLVLSRLDYCNSLLYGTSASLIHSLQRTQNNLAKLVLLNPSLNSSECLRQLHWLPIHLRIIFKISLITYRTLATSNPPYLNQLIHRRHIPNHLRSSSAIHLHQPVHRSSIVNRGFNYASPAIWNDLPPIIRSQPSLELFKRQLKTHLFKIAFDGEPRRLWRSAYGAIKMNYYYYYYYYYSRINICGSGVRPYGGRVLAKKSFQIRCSQSRYRVLQIETWLGNLSQWYHCWL